MGSRYGRQMGQGRQMGTNLSERDMLQDMLLTEKYLAEVLNHAILESSSNQTRQMFQSFQDNAQGHAQMIYSEMSDQGWYNVQGTKGQGMQQQAQRYRTGGATQQQGYGYTRPRGRYNRDFDTRETVRSGWQKTF